MLFEVATPLPRRIGTRLIETIITDYISVADIFDEEAIGNVLYDIESYDGNKRDINNWIYSAKSLTFYSILELIRNYTDENDILSELVRLEEDFSPFVNYLDSHFNNIIDQVDLKASQQEIIDQTFLLLDSN